MIKTQRRLTRLFSLVAGAATTAAISLPAAAFAASPFPFPASGEASAVADPAPLSSDITRSQVEADAATALREGRIAFGNYDVPPAPAVGQPKTRQQVVNELLSETPSERLALQRLYNRG
jgi:hypothetical protein